MLAYIVFIEMKYAFLSDEKSTCWFKIKELFLTEEYLFAHRETCFPLVIKS